MKRWYNVVVSCLGILHFSFGMPALLNQKISLLPVPSKVYAAEVDDEFKGFGDEDDFEFKSEDSLVNIEYDVLSSPPDSEQTFRTGGFIKQEIAFSCQNGVTWRKLRSILNLDVDAKFFSVWSALLTVNGFHDFAYTVEGRRNFDRDTIDVYETDIDIRDCYIEGPLTSDLRMKVGRQIIAWGESDFAQVSDLANPRDQLELGFVDMENARIPVAATRLTWLKNKWELSIAAIHEVRPNKIAPKGADFDRFGTIRSQMVIVEPDEAPAIHLKHTEFITRLFRPFHGGDISLIAAHVYDDDPVLILKEFRIVPDLSTIFTPVHEPYTLAGITGNHVLNAYLIKGELAYIHDRSYNRSDLERQLSDYITNTSPVSTIEKKDAARIMLGVEYSGISDFRITIEWTLEHIINHSPYLVFHENTQTLYLLTRYDALNARMNTDIQFVYLMREEATILKIATAYDLTDALEVSAGFLVYDGWDAEAWFYPYRNEDRVFVGGKYSF